MIYNIILYAYYIMLHKFCRILNFFNVLKLTRTRRKINIESIFFNNINYNARGLNDNFHQSFNTKIMYYSSQTYKQSSKFLQLPIILSQLHAAVVFIVSLNVHLDCWETPLQHRVLPVACVA